MLAPWWQQFLGYAAMFGLLIWLLGHVIIGEPAPWWSLLAQAVVYGLIMTWLTRHSVRQTDRSLGLQPDVAQRLELAQTLKTAKLPEDAKLRAALPAYLDRVERQNKRVRLIGPAEFLVFTGLALYLAIVSDNPAWYAFTGLFFGFGLLCYFQPTATLHRVAKLRRSAKRAATRDAKLAEAAAAEKAAAKAERAKAKAKAERQAAKAQTQVKPAKKSKPAKK